MLSHLYASGILAQGELLEWLISAKNLLLVLLGFSFVVFVHELGHFLAAKWAGVRVEKFCIGFGPELFGFTRGETRYGFNILPLGGYVKMLGQEDFAVDKAGELKVRDNPDSFTNKGVGPRMVIVSAGVIMNLIFAVIGLTIYMMVGYIAQPPVIGAIAPATPAAQAGLMVGDRITAINGHPIREFKDLPMRIALSDSGEELEIDVIRDGKLVLPKPHILPRFNEQESVRQIGIGPGANRTVMATWMPPTEATESDLQQNDRIDAIVKGDKTTPVRSMADVWQALAAARGEPVELIVNRPTEKTSPRDLVRMDDENRPGKPVHVTARARWYLYPEEPGKPATASLLGLIPRVAVTSVEPNSPADAAGVETLDTLVEFDGFTAPLANELQEMAVARGGQDCTLIVRRARAKNNDLSAGGVAFVSRHREAWLQAAVNDLVAARNQVVTAVATSGLSNEDAAAVVRHANRCRTAHDWLAWLESIDLHAMSVRPAAPFKLTGGGKPRIGIGMDLPEDDRLVVASIQPRIAGGASPASRAGIPAGAVLLAVDGAPVATWADLTEAFRTHAGRTVALRYRTGIQYHETKLDVPEDLASRTDLPAEPYIQEIEGRTRIETTAANGQPRTLFLPNWDAVREILKANIGKTVTVRYATPTGDSHDVKYAVNAENTDPWLLRVSYQAQQMFMGYPLLTAVKESNPLAAMKHGIEKTYLFTWSTVQSLRHIIFTRQVGVDKISGPVGIARVGMHVAEMGWMELLFYMCLISANLAVINFLPLPIVDGGLFFFLLLEKIRGEPISIRVQAATQVIGILLIASIFLFVTAQDLMNWNSR